MVESGLLSSLQKIPLERNIICRDGRYYTCQKLLELISGLREKYRLLQGKNVAIKISDSFEFIKAIVALDGWAKSILILPHSIDGKLAEELIAEEKSQYLLSSSEVKSFDTNSASQVDQDTCWVLATSGTTGRPKLVCHSFTGLSRTVVRNIKKGAEYRWGLFYDPARFAGLQVVLQSLISGSLLVIVGQDSFAEQLHAANLHKVNALSATPSLWRKLLMSEESKGLSLDLISLGGEISDQVLLNQLKKQYPKAKIRHIYASTEAGVGFAVGDGLAGFPVDWLDNNQAGVEMKIHEDRLFIKPALLPSGKEIQQRLDEQGFLDSGDCVEVTGSRVIFKGRASGVINVGGNKVQPEEIEMIIRQLDAIADVRVFAKASPILGQLVCADLVMSAKDADPKQLKDEVIQHCKTKLDTYKIPALLKFVDNIPVSFSGKVVRS